jgi:hypothetical protein
MGKTLEIELRGRPFLQSGVAMEHLGVEYTFLHFHRWWLGGNN